MPSPKLNSNVFPEFKFDGTKSKELLPVWLTVKLQLPPDGPLVITTCEQ
jgi:hypothetical protein